MNKNIAMDYIYIFFFFIKPCVNLQNLRFYERYGNIIYRLTIRGLTTRSHSKYAIHCDVIDRY